MMSLLTMRQSAALTIVLCLLLQQVESVRNLRILSPLQALTIPDRSQNSEEEEDAHPTRRQIFLSRFKAGLTAEANVRKDLSEKRKAAIQTDVMSKDWARKAAAADARRRKQDEALAEKAFLEAFNQEKPAKIPAANNRSMYQFVGLINPPSSKRAITWFARPKPSGAKWTLRLVHVNREAIIKDLFHQGKVDLFARYHNTGEKMAESNAPVIYRSYSVRERSWRNLWNFSAKHFITDSSGMYWRERRLRPGLYTDGNNVYEASYRYRDGRNGMHRVSSFQQFLASKAIEDKKKESIIRRLAADVPDVVLED